MRRRGREGLADRARGTLLGLAVGDALGAAGEWLHPDPIHARYGGPLRDLVETPMWEQIDREWGGLEGRGPGETWKRRWVGRASRE